MTNPAGTIAVITGGARGLGLGVARRLASMGANVVIWDLDQHAADDAAAAVGGKGYACDVSNPDAVRDAAARVTAEVGQPSILVNNAGVVSGRHFLDLSEADIRRTFDVNALALFWTTRAFLPAMLDAGRGHIVTVASAAGTIGVPRLSDYCASKWAAVGFDESLRVELRHRAPHVRTTVVCPFYIGNGMFDGAQTRWPWLLPILDENRVCDAIVDAIASDRQRVFLPPVVGLLPLLRWLPTPVLDQAVEWLGVHDTMNDFRGRG